MQDVKNPYAKRSIFKPKVRYSFGKEGDAKEDSDMKETTRQKFRYALTFKCWNKTLIHFHCIENLL